MRKKEKPMQIILVQTEVVQALRDYVASRLTLAEGTEITVDLSATRGANGVTATIDLVEPGQKAAPQQVLAPATKATPAVAKPETATKAPEAQQATQVAQQAEQAQEQATGTAEMASDTASTETATATGDQAKADEAKPAEGETAAAPTKSLFGNLPRPKN